VPKGLSYSKFTSGMKRGREVAWAAIAGSVTKVPPCPSDDRAKLDAVYWPSRASVATCEPSDTVSVPPVLADEGAEHRFGIAKFEELRDAFDRRSSRVHRSRGGSGLDQRRIPAVLVCHFQKSHSNFGV
jgi:hypothetical protein